MRVRHELTFAVGTTVGRPIGRLHQWDDEGPWFRVQFDDGLFCKVPASRLHVQTALGWI